MPEPTKVIKVTQNKAGFYTLQTAAGETFTSYTRDGGDANSVFPNLASFVKDVEDRNSGIIRTPPKTYSNVAANVKPTGRVTTTGTGYTYSTLTDGRIKVVSPDGRSVISNVPPGMSVQQFVSQVANQSFGVPLNSLTQTMVEGARGLTSELSNSLPFLGSTGLTSVIDNAAVGLANEFGTAANQVINGITSPLNSLAGLVDPSGQIFGNTLGSLGLLNSNLNFSPDIGIGSGSGNIGAIDDPEVDMRIRIRPRITQQAEVFGDGAGPMGPLYETNGMVYMYTPVISYSHSVNYNPMNFTHSNQDFYFFNNSPSVQIQISGRFTAQTEAEAAYAFACMHFLRTVTKMRFGASDPQRGLPPPMLLLDGYGNFMFNQLPIIITQYSFDLPQDVDYVEIPINAQGGGGTAWVPVDFNIAATCIVQQTPDALRTQFNLDQFRSGGLLGTSGRGWI